MKKIVKILMILLGIAILAWPIFYYFSKVNSKKVNYTLKKAEYKGIENFILSSGFITPSEKVKIKSRIAGVLEGIYVKNGDSISKNQPIAKISVIPDAVQLSSAQSRIRFSKLANENQRKIYSRDKILYEKGVISRADFERSENAFLNSKEELNIALRNYKIIKTGNDNSLEKTNTIISSTIDGIVTELPTKVGSSIIQSNNFNEGTTIATIANFEKMVFEGTIKEYELQNIKDNADVLITTSVNDKVLSGRLIEVSTNGKSVNGTVMFDVKCLVNDYSLKKTGISANAKILTLKKENILCINEDWLNFRNDSAFVKVHLDEDHFEERYIKLGVSDGLFTEVLYGLQKQEMIRFYDSK